MSEADNIGKALLAHLVWRNKLREAIETGESPLTVAAARSDHECEFGKWFHTLPATLMQSEHWKEVNALHAEVHALGAKILQLALAGHKQEAQAAMAPGSRFAAVISQLSKALEKWKVALKKGPDLSSSTGRVRGQ